MFAWRAVLRELEGRLLDSLAFGNGLGEPLTWEQCRAWQAGWLCLAGETWHCGPVLCDGQARAEGVEKLPVVLLLGVCVGAGVSWVLLNTSWTLLKTSVCSEKPLVSVDCPNRCHQQISTDCWGWCFGRDRGRWHVANEQWALLAQGTQGCLVGQQDRPCLAILVLYTFIPPSLAAWSKFLHLPPESSVSFLLLVPAPLSSISFLSAASPPFVFIWCSGFCLEYFWLSAASFRWHPLHERTLLDCAQEREWEPRPLL